MEKGCGGEIDGLPTDLLSYIFALLTSFTDLAQASGVSRKWREGVKQSVGRRERLSFAGWKMDDHSTSRLLHLAFSLKQLDMYLSLCFSVDQFNSLSTIKQSAAEPFKTLINERSRSRWGCHITDQGLERISSAYCIPNLTSISLWGITGITDLGVLHLISKAKSLQHLNIGGTFITDDSLFAIADSCPDLKSIVLWSCRHVTQVGLVRLVHKCQKLQVIDVWGTRVPVDCFIALLAISPALQIKPAALLLPVA
ncbi:F-box protein At5g67140 [Linum grandiflorum]